MSEKTTDPKAGRQVSLTEDSESPGLLKKSHLWTNQSLSRGSNRRLKTRPPAPCPRRPQAQQVSGRFYHPSKFCIKCRPKLGFTSVQMFERHPCRITWHAVGVSDGTVSNAQTRESSPERPQPASCPFRRLQESGNKKISHIPEGGSPRCRLQHIPRLVRASWLTGGLLAVSPQREGQGCSLGFPLRVRIPPQSSTS